MFDDNGLLRHEISTVPISISHATRNPDKYNKNAERNRLKDIEAERARIRTAAIKQVQRLAADHDLSGVIFNIGPVVRKDDGSVVSAEAARKRLDRVAATAAVRNTLGKQNGDFQQGQEPHFAGDRLGSKPSKSIHDVKPNVHPERMSQIADNPTPQQQSLGLQPGACPSKPRIPDGISVPEGEENWLALWDLCDEEVEKRIMRAKKGKAAERKALRIMQQSGKSERREARDEKRKVYRDIKLIWKSIKEQYAKERTILKAVEDEESKTIALEVNKAERRTALGLCESLGFTIYNTPGIEDIKPRALGIRGREVNFAASKGRQCKGDVEARKEKRVNLEEIANKVDETYVPTEEVRNLEENETFIKFNIGEGQDHEALNSNHKLRRKLRRALNNAQVRKEMLVRQRTIDHLDAKGLALPNELKTGGKAKNIKGMRILENGGIETAKQERVRKRVELAEFNNASKVLRRQAKQCAIEAGLRKHAALTGRLFPDSRNTNAGSVRMPAYINASAKQAQVTMAATERNHLETQSALE
ncbi:MAG: hypothetical protein Q9169_004631 [Polycauliona sp. 2 TL-2023]